MVAPTKFKVHFSNMSCMDLPAMDRSGTSDPYLQINFDNWKKFETPVIKKTLNPFWTGFTETFVYETKYPEKLSQKYLSIKVYDKNKITSDDYIGTVKVDLHTLMTGPAFHTLAVKDGSNTVGYMKFDLHMQEITNTHLVTESITIKNLPQYSGKPPNTFIKLVHNRSDHSSVSRQQRDCNPCFEKVPNLLIVQPFEEFVESKIFIHLIQKEKEERKIIDVGIKIGDYCLTRDEPFSVNQLLRQGSEEISICCKFSWKNFPNRVQMLEGLHNDKGIINGCLFHSKVELPSTTCIPPVEDLVKAAEDKESRIAPVESVFAGIDLNCSMPEEETTVSNFPDPSPAVTESPITSEDEKEENVEAEESASIDQASEKEEDRGYLAAEEYSDLPGGFEKRTTKDGRTFYVDHFTKKTSWEAPGTLPNGWERILTKSDKVVYVDHILKTTQWDAPESLPEGFERKLHESGRILYLDHFLKKTSWDAPRPLPTGWERIFHDSSGKCLYVDHKNKHTQWEIPE